MVFKIKSGEGVEIEIKDGEINIVINLVLVQFVIIHTSSLPGR